MKLTAALVFLCSILSIASVSTPSTPTTRRETQSNTKPPIQAMIPPVGPGASWFGPGVRIASIVCSDTTTPIKTTLARATLQRFCTEHQGVNLAQGGNFSTYYDADEDGMRLFFNVVNQCAPNGVYLPLSACVNGFAAVTRCLVAAPVGGYDGVDDSTSLGQASTDCLGFDFYAEAKEVAAVELG
jgi:hypothetical protein